VLHRFETLNSGGLFRVEDLTDCCQSQDGDRVAPRRRRFALDAHL